jgi:hypothetical protein
MGRSLKDQAASNATSDLGSSSSVLRLIWTRSHLECRATTKYLRQSRVQHPDAFRIRGSFRVSQDRLVTNARKLRASWYLSGEVTALRTTRTAPNLAQALS